jgi:hypothetical protein
MNPINFFTLNLILLSSTSPVAVIYKWVTPSALTWLVINLIFLNRASPIDMIYKGVAPCALTWFMKGSHLSCHVDSITQEQSARLIHKTCQLDWHDSITPDHLRVTSAHKRASTLLPHSSPLSSSFLPLRRLHWWFLSSQLHMKPVVR